MRRLLVGPARDVPSWWWCAADLLEGLRSDFEVATFAQFEECRCRQADVVLVVKHLPAPGTSLQLPIGSKLAYVPVDYFDSPEHVASQEAFLRRCDALLLHSGRLVPVLGRYCGNTMLVEHYGKYVLPEPREFEAGGFVLWVGFVENASYTVDWFLGEPRSFGLKVVTNCPFNTPERERRGLVQVKWSEGVQRELMEGAKAGVDIKGQNFAQFTKPPTKVQQFVASGISVATNPDSYAWEYFHARGLDLVAPGDLGRWFSREYWEETRAAGERLREEISRERVVKSYVDCLSRL